MCRIKPYKALIFETNGQSFLAYHYSIMLSSFRLISKNYCFLVSFCPFKLITWKNNCDVNFLILDSEVEGRKSWLWKKHNKFERNDWIAKWKGVSFRKTISWNGKFTSRTRRVCCIMDINWKYSSFVSVIFCFIYLFIFLSLKYSRKIIIFLQHYWRTENIKWRTETGNGKLSRTRSRVIKFYRKIDQ